MIFSISKLNTISTILIIAAFLAGCATSQSTVQQQAPDSLAEARGLLCSDGTSPICITHMGRPSKCSCSAKEDMRDMLENRGVHEAERARSAQGR